jgi:hypothetical protein
VTADQDVNNAANGNSGPGTPALPFALVARFYDAHMFGLNKDYAYPEGSNVSASRWDSITSLDKLLTRTMKLADGNDYTVWDALMTLAKAEVLANPHINDDEPLSVNYTGTPAAQSATAKALEDYKAQQ